ncbi:MAG: thiosulfate oxidation carrier complex protein SoxZ [Acetobacter sp.]|nr:thiosulfate oxidation carrier complex protein SoxZ [Bacteroides sp.]MCM1340413.1 thiosulfate oxidation carrier complex protein SoxZ [Acetobacter sp.]MCM1432940.1 thiosulfate oxidation carrier complex protein SoxZ [Clostridiales bacterium]
MTMTKKQKLVSIAFAFSAMLAAVIFFCLPSYVQAAELGTENPYIYFTYEKDGEEVNGNDLAYDTKYFCNIWIEGVENLSTLEVTATYDDTVTCSTAPDTLMSDNVADITSIGYLLNDGNMVFGFVSDNANNSAIDPEGTLVASLEVTFSSFEGAEEVLDAENHISVSENPNLTFAQVDYADGYENEYAVADENNIYGDYVGERYPLLTYDVSPAKGHTVSGSIVVMTDQYGTVSNKAAHGEYTIEIYSDQDKTKLVDTVISQNVVENSVTTNQFKTNVPLPNGTYYATVSFKYALTRDDVTIIVDNQDITGAVIPVIACDFRADETIDISDTMNISNEASQGSIDLLYDLNDDSIVDVSDTMIVKLCAASQWAAEPIVIKADLN